MDRTDNESGAFLLHLISPDGEEHRVPCDSVRFSIPDGEKGRGGGSVGIRRGHAEALMAVSPGILTASKTGGMVFRARIGTGIAAVTGDRVTVLAPFTAGD